MSTLVFRCIFHVDMNSYFASCEQQANPFLRGKPIGVCEHLGGIIIAPSIEAKKFGVKTGMPVWEAKKLCPQIKLFFTDPEKYRETTHRFLYIFGKYTEEIEKYSIDEAFLDLTANVKDFVDPWTEAERIAVEIKKEMKKYVGDWIQCSIGIGANKFIAKIGSDLQKPNGLTIVRPEDKDFLYDRLKLTDVPGIAWRTERNLNLLGIKSLRDLRDYPESNLIAHFGIVGRHLHMMGNLEGSWHESFESEEQAAKQKSMGHAYTLPKRCDDIKVASQMLYKISEMVGKRLREGGVVANIVHLIVNDKEGSYYQKSKKLNYYLQDGRDIFLEVNNMFIERARTSSKFKLIGVTASGLKDFSNQQSLFETDRKKELLVKSLDKINDKYGDSTISRVPVWQAQDYIRDSVGFGRMREFKVKYKGKK
ncbi:MAG: polymerase [Candidatus Doudnabacteria bacterium]|nr:polymerase [Candidatus Doudnabacteria bacterium]